MSWNTRLRPTVYETRNLAKKFAGQECWLTIGGIEYPARVTGRKNTFATIAPIDVTIPSIEYNWHVVARIMNGNKLFYASPKKTGPLYQALAILCQARLTCVESNNLEWKEKHEQEIKELVAEWLPHGSGVDDEVVFDLERSNANKLVLRFGYHHTNEVGMYDGWTFHVCTVRPSLTNDFELKISGPNRNDVKEYLYQVFEAALRNVPSAAL